MRPSPKKQRIAGGLRRTTLASYRLENWCPFWCPFGLPNRTNHSCTSKWKWWLGAELNRRHKDFQSSALPTELPSRVERVESGKRIIPRTTALQLCHNSVIQCKCGKNDQEWARQRRGWQIYL